LAHPKILAWRPLCKTLADFKGALRARRGEEGRRTEREKRGRNEERRGEESWNRATDWLRLALQSNERNSERENF